MMNKEEKIVNGYYQSNIKTSRNEDNVYAMKYASQQMLIDKLQEKLDKILTYAKDRCDGYLEDLKEGHLDCEYCDGVFASCRKVLQLAGEDISEYE